MRGNVSGVSSPTPVLPSVDTLEIRFFLMASSVALAPELPWILQPSLRRASTELPPSIHRASAQLPVKQWQQVNHSAAVWLYLLRPPSLSPHSSCLGLQVCSMRLFMRKCGLRYSTLEVVPIIVPRSKPVHRSRVL